MSLTDEIKSIREGVGIYEASDYGQIFMTGADAASFLHRMLSNEVNGLKIGEGRYQGLLDRKGMVLSLFYLLRLENERFLAVLPPQLTSKTRDLLNKMKFIQKVSLQDVSQERRLIQVIGPKAEEALKDNIPEGAIVWRDDVFGTPVLNFSVPTNVGVQNFEPLRRTTQLSPDAIRLMKMEAGFPEYGVDLGENHILLETRLPYVFQRNKGCYPGQEVIERINTYGKGRTARVIRVFQIEGKKEIPKTSEILTESGEMAGNISSSAYNPFSDKTLVMGTLEAKFVNNTLFVQSHPLTHLTT